jgi:hypothetical protein
MRPSMEQTKGAPQGLSRQAYEPIPEGDSYRPFVPAGDSLAEFTIKAVVSGILFGILFGFANAYLGLRVGLTISTSIPVAVMTVAVFRVLRGLGATATVLEANTSQTVGSASSSVASGVIFTLPALFLWGLAPGLLQMTLLAMCGGLLGVLFMVPLRRFLIQGEHGRLPYPEGTACAEVLVASEIGGAKARNVFRGLAVGALFKFVLGWLKMLPDGLLHPRAPHRRHHGGRRAVVVAGDHPGPRLVGRGADDAALPGDGAAHQRHGAVAAVDPLRALYRCRRGGHRRSDHPDPQHPDDDRELQGGRPPVALAAERRGRRREAHRS